MLQCGPDLDLGPEVSVRPPFDQPAPVWRKRDNIVHRGIAKAVRVKAGRLVNGVRRIDLKLVLQNFADPPDVLQVVGNDPEADQVGYLVQRVLVLRPLAADLLGGAAVGLKASPDLDDLKICFREKVDH